jgi:hypothetical protein
MIRSRKVMVGGLSAVLAVGTIGGVMAAGPGFDGPGDSGPRPGVHDHPHRLHHAPVGLLAIVRESGLEPAVFREGGDAGKTVAEILEGNGLVPADIKAEILAKLDERLDEAVANGRIEQSTADDLLAAAEARLAELMETVPDRPDHPHLRWHAAHGLIASAAQTIGIEPAELVDSLKAGETIADVAIDHGVDPQLVITNAVAKAHQRIDQAVADGNLDPGRAEAMKARAEERIAAAVHEGGPR